MDQSNRYARLDLTESELIAAGRHVLTAYNMKPKAGYDFLSTAAHFAAESSTGTNVEVSTTDDFLDVFGEDAPHVAFLVDGYVAGCTAVRRYFPNQFLHYHRAGHGAVTSPQSKRGYTAFVHCKMARLSGASGIHVGTMGYGKMEGGKEDTNIAYMIERDSADGPYFHQEWRDMKATTPIISGGMNALRLPGFFENLGHCNVIQTSGGGAAGAISLKQARDAWMAGVNLVEYAKEHSELKGAFESFQADADALYPGWREALGLAF